MVLIENKWTNSNPKKTCMDLFLAKGLRNWDMEEKFTVNKKLKAPITSININKV